MEVVVLVPKIEGVLECGRTTVLQANPPGCSRWAGTREGVPRRPVQEVMLVRPKSRGSRG